MGYYRLYLLKGPGGHFVGMHEIEADDDIEAVRMAEAYSGPQPLELWCGKRQVTSIPGVEIVLRGGLDPEPA